MINRYASLRQGLVLAYCPSLGASGFRSIDRSGYGNHGTLTNMDPGTDWVGSASGLALDFDGTNDYVNAISPTRFAELSTGSITVTFWNRNSSGTSGVYFSLCSSTAGTQFLIFQASGASIALAQRNDAGGDTTITGGTWQSSSWRLLTAISTPAALSLFSNGVQLASTTRTSAVTTFNQVTLSALNRAGSLSNYAVSQIDDVRIYNRALTLSEINLLYTGGRGVGLLPERVKHRRKTTAAATNRRRRIICGANC
jgi:hypothetical protein